MPTTQNDINKEEGEREAVAVAVAKEIKAEEQEERARRVNTGAEVKY